MSDVISLICIYREDIKLIKRIILPEEKERTDAKKEVSQEQGQRSLRLGSKYISI